MLALENALIPTHYALELSIDPAEQGFSVVATIVLEERVSGAASFALHCKDLTITEATLDDSLQLKVAAQNDNEQVVFSTPDGQPIPAANSHSLRIVYTGKVNDVRTARDKTLGLFRANYMREDGGSAGADSYIYATHCQPSFARRFLPCVDEPAVKATFQLTITSLARFTAVSVSPVDSIAKLEDDKRSTTTFHKTELLPVSLFGFVLGDLERISLELPGKADEKPLPISVYSPLRVAQATYAMDIAQKYIPLLQQFFGCAFPAPKLDFVLLPFLNDMVMENFSMITVQMDFLLLSPQSLANEQVRNQTLQLVVHEMVHQWMGNYLSFDSWEHLAFNESFATFLAYDLISKHEDGIDIWESDNYLNNELGGTMLADSDLQTSKSIYDAFHSQREARTRLGVTTNEIFDPVSYQKGITMLRSLQLSTGESFFQQAIAAVFAETKQFHDVAVKPMDIFTKMGEVLKSQNVANFVSSWTKLPGLPVVSVSTTIDETSKQLASTLTQHRFFAADNIDAEFKKDEIEDVPYHVALMTQLPGGEADDKNTLMTDRSLKLNYRVTALNSKAQGYYRVSYETQECYDEICKELTLGNISDLTLLKIFQDLSYFIGNKFFQLPVHITGAMQILNHIASAPADVKLGDLKLWKALAEGLSVMQTIVQAAVVHNRRAIITKISKLATKLSQKADNWSVEGIAKVQDGYELQTLSKIIALTSTTKPTQELCQELFKHIRQGPNNSVPIEIVSSVYMSISYQMTTIKEWKKLFELIKSSAGIASHISDDSGTPESQKAIMLQNLAITNLGFVTTEELVSKLLNFINTNIAAEGIENAFIGVNYNAQVVINKSSGLKVRDAVWKWFKLNHAQWKKTLSRGTNNNNTADERLEKITFMVLQMFVESGKMIEKYEHFDDIKSVWETLQREDRANTTIIAGFTK